MQGPQGNLISLSDKVLAFMMKLNVSKRRVTAGVTEMFAVMHAFLQLLENSLINREHIHELVCENIPSLSEQFMLYFGDLNVQHKSWVCDPFSANIDEVELQMLEVL